MPANCITPIDSVKLNAELNAIKTKNCAMPDIIRLLKPGVGLIVKVAGLRT